MRTQEIIWSAESVPRIFVTCWQANFYKTTMGAKTSLFQLVIQIVPKGIYHLQIWQMYVMSWSASALAIGLVSHMPSFFWSLPQSLPTLCSLTLTPWCPLLLLATVDDGVATIVQPPSKFLGGGGCIYWWKHKYSEPSLGRFLSWYPGSASITSQYT